MPKAVSIGLFGVASLVAQGESDAEEAAEEATDEAEKALEDKADEAEKAVEEKADTAEEQLRSLGISIDCASLGGVP